MADINWSMVAAISIIVTFIGGVALLWLQSRLSGEFTTIGAFKALTDRVAKLEQDLSRAPTHRDIQEHSERVRAVELGVAVMQESVASMKESMSRIDLGVRRIEQHLLENNK